MKMRENFTKILGYDNNNLSVKIHIHGQTSSLAFGDKTCMKHEDF